MKKNLFLLMLGVFFIFSCSKEEEGPDSQSEKLEEASLNFGTEGQEVVEVPDALLNQSDNQYVSSIISWLSDANSITTYSAFFQIPSGATKTDQPIVAGNSRVAATAEEYLVYVYDGSQYGYGSMAYQVHEEGDKYVFELFFKYETDGEWLRFIYAEQNQTLNEGKLLYYFGESTAIYSYEWSIADDILKYEMYLNGDLKYKITQNQNTLAGTIEYYYPGYLYEEITWNADGSGTFKTYNDDGSVSKTGSWTAG